METHVRETGDMVRVLEITADASDLETDVRLAEKKQQKLTVRRGFRPGHVPMKMIRRIYASEIKDIIVQNLVEEVYDDMVAQNHAYRTVGNPQEIQRNYKLGEDLHVQIEFYVLPELKLKDLSGQVVEVPVSTVSNELIEYVKRIRMIPYLPTRPLQEDERIGELNAGMFDRVTYRSENIDPETGFVLIGGRSKDVKEYNFGEAILVSDAAHELGEIFEGYSVGDQIILNQSDDASDLIRLDLIDSDLRIEILAAERYEWPEIDDEWAAKISDHFVDSSEELDEWARGYLEDILGGLSEELAEVMVKERMVALHPFTIPEGFMEQAKSLMSDELHAAVEALETTDRLRKDMRWILLLRALSEELKITLWDSSDTDALSTDADVESSDEVEMLSRLVDQFEVKEVPATELMMMRIVANRNLP